MKISLSGAELFLEYLSGHATAQQVLAHPAYEAVCAHARRISNRIDPEDLDAALIGEPSSFYGLKQVRERMPRVRALMDTVRAREQRWLEDASSELARLLPGEDLGSITVYPIIGYDMGIGLQETVCMNLNWEPYLADPEEFFYFIIHEAFHCLYERSHAIPLLEEVGSPAQWLSYFHLWLHNEGFATYAPLRIREERSAVGEAAAFGDYAVMLDEERVREHFAAFRETSTLIAGGKPAGQDEYLDLLFGPKRLAYRAGCSLIRRIERTYGYEAVQRAVYLTGDEFVEAYGGLLGAQGRTE